MPALFRRPAVLLLASPRCIHPGNQALGRRFLITRGTINLSTKKQPINESRFKTWVLSRGDQRNRILLRSLPESFVPIQSL